MCMTPTSQKRQTCRIPFQQTDKLRKFWLSENLFSLHSSLSICSRGMVRPSLTSHHYRLQEHVPFFFKTLKMCKSCLKKSHFWSASTLRYARSSWRTLCTVQTDNSNPLQILNRLSLVLKNQFLHSLCIHERLWFAVLTGSITTTTIMHNQLFSNSLHHILSWCVLTTPFPYTSINWQ